MPLRNLIPVLVLTAALAQGKTWELRNGDTLEGALLQFKNGMVVIDLDAGGNALHPLSQFTEADQATILEQFPGGNQRVEVRTVRTKRKDDQRSPAQQVLRDLAMGNSWERQTTPKAPRTVLPAAPHFANLKIGYSPPDTTVYPQGSPEGFPLSDWRGKVILVHFWSAQDSTSIQALPWVVSLYKKYHQKGLEVAGICMTAQRSLMNRYEAQNGITWPAAQDRASRIAETWGVTYMPGYVLIDQNFRVIRDNLRTTELDSAVRAALGL